MLSRFNIGRSVKREFLPRSFLHILPQGLVRIRHFAFLANRRRTTFSTTLLAVAALNPETIAEERSSPTAEAPDLCPCPK